MERDVKENWIIVAVIALLTLAALFGGGCATAPEVYPIPAIEYQGYTFLRAGDSYTVEGARWEVTGENVYLCIRYDLFQEFYRLRMDESRVRRDSAVKQ